MKILKNLTKKAVKRRRSNWYIYLISFAATFVLLCLFVLAFRHVLFPSGNNNSNRGVYTPDAELDTSIMFMLGDSQGGVPSKFMLVNYRAADEVIVLVPLNADTRVTGTGRDTSSGSLTEIYSRGGAAVLTQSIAQTLSIDIPYYVQFDRSSFTAFAADLGEFRVNVPFDFEGGGLSLKSGNHRLSAENLFLYMNFANFPQAGANFKQVVTGSAIMNLINTNLRQKDAEVIQTTFTKMLNNATTNITNSDFRTYQQALLYTSENSINPASYFLPGGAYVGEDFLLDSQSILEIKSKFGLE